MQLKQWNLSIDFSAYSYHKININKAISSYCWKAVSFSDCLSDNARYVDIDAGVNGMYLTGTVSWSMVG